MLRLTTRIHILPHEGTCHDCKRTLPYQQLSECSTCGYICPDCSCDCPSPVESVKDAFYVLQAERERMAEELRRALAIIEAPGAFEAARVARAASW